jgi:UDP-2,3-diacylglucosamine pyrophosphatase LpxH
MGTMVNRYRTVWLSDIHLGSRDCRVELLLEFLESFECDILYLVGDIVDIERMRRRFYWPNTHTAVLARFLEMAQGGTRVVYLPGNHDETFRTLVDVPLGPVETADEMIHETLDGRRLLVFHGDRFDAILRAGPFARAVGCAGYRLLVGVNRLNHWFNDRFGRPYWSLANVVKSRIGSANRYIEEFQRACLNAAREAGVDGVVCGHIHRAEIVSRDGLVYYNDGDWVENCTALLETLDGAMELCHWTDRRAEQLSERLPAAAGLREAA